LYRKDIIFIFTNKDFFYFFHYCPTKIRYCFTSLHSEWQWI